MKPLKFLNLTTFYPPHSFGGDAIGIQRLCRALVRRGHEVTVAHDTDAYEVLAPGRGHEVPADDMDEGVRVRRLASRVPKLSTLLTQQLGRPIVNGSAIRRLIADGDFDVVVFHNTSLIGGPGLFRYAEGRLSVYMAHEHWLVCPTHVLWRHGRELCTGRECLRCSVAYRRPPQLWRYTGFLERELERIDLVIAMSEFSRTKHREMGCQASMEVLPYFLPDPEPAKPVYPAPHSRPFFLFVGRLERIKGLDDVIPAFRDYPDADLLIAGDGTYESHLKALAAGGPNVRFLGRVTPEALRAYYQHAIALVVPSECYETFGIVLIEAFRQGTPVIARRLGPFPEIVEASGGGELFTTDAELGSAMRRLQHEPGLRAARAAAGYAAYEARWSERVVVPRYLELVRDAASRKGNRRVADALAEEVS
jgi:glycosyltransferase involved in cell wall biosynthesis